MNSYLKLQPEGDIVRPARPTASDPEASRFQGWGPRL